MKKTFFMVMLFIYLSFICLGSFACTENTSTNNSNNANDVNLCSYGHDYETRITTEPTCTTTGTKQYTCTKCGHTKTETLEKTSHNYINGVCLNCQAKDLSYVNITVENNGAILNYYDHCAWQVTANVTYTSGSWTVQGSQTDGHVEINFTIKKTYDEKGNNSTRSGHFNFNVKSNGIILGTRLVFTPNLKVGDTAITYYDFYTKGLSGEIVFELLGK